MEIFRAASADHHRIYAFYNSLIDGLEGLTYSPAWKKDIYPTSEDLKNAIEQGWLYYGVINNRIAAAMVLNHLQNDAYKNPDWKTIAADEEVMVIHLLGVHKDFTRQGTGLAMVRYAVSLAKETGMKTLRLDVLKGNLPAEKLYEKAGFVYITTIPMFYEDTGWEEFSLYEYPLLSS